jgi:dTDP-L-rhamnose 4-epimerase
VLVTGGAGFIGSHVAEALLSAGHEVRVLDALLPCAHPGGVPPFRGDPGFEFIHGDIRDAQAIDVALLGAGAVCHLAAMVGLGVDFDDAPLCTGCNDLGTAVLLAAMARAGAGRLVLASSMVVYGEGAYSCAEHGLAATPPPRHAADLQAGRFEPRCVRTGHAARHAVRRGGVVLPLLASGWPGTAGLRGRGTAPGLRARPRRRQSDRRRCLRREVLIGAAGTKRI